MEPRATQLARKIKQKKWATDLMSQIAHVTRDYGTIEITGFSHGDKLFAFSRGFHGLKSLPNIFSPIKHIFSPKT